MGSLRLRPLFVSILASGFATELHVPDDSYTLVVGANGSGESPYGSATAGPIPVTLDTCP